MPSRRASWSSQAPLYCVGDSPGWHWRRCDAALGRARWSASPPATAPRSSTRGAQAERPPGRAMPPSARTIAVALHDVEPATFERCALLRDWLDDHGVDRVPLLVIPARDPHPFDRRSPELAGWLSQRRTAGDAVAPQGFFP